jgi:hypothetical protein
MITVALLILWIWSVVLTVQLIAVIADLRRLRIELAARAQLVTLIADNAKEGARFMADHRTRIERLESILVRPPSARRAEGPN